MSFNAVVYHCRMCGCPLNSWKSFSRAPCPWFLPPSWNLVRSFRNLDQVRDHPFVNQVAEDILLLPQWKEVVSRANSLVCSWIMALTTAMSMAMHQKPQSHVVTRKPSGLPLPVIQRSSASGKFASICQNRWIVLTVVPPKFTWPLESHSQGRSALSERDSNVELHSLGKKIVQPLLHV